MSDEFLRPEQQDEQNMNTENENRQEQPAAQEQQIYQEQPTYQEPQVQQAPNYYQDMGMTPNQMKQEKPGQAFGITSMVLGIISLVLFCTCINYVLGIVAIIFGILQLVKRGSSKGMAIAGIITAGVSILLSIIMWVAIFFNSTFRTEFQREFNNQWEQNQSGQESPFSDDEDNTF